METLIAALRDASVCEGAVEVLERIGWHPGQDEIGAFYWVVKRKWNKCIEIGAPAVEPLVAALKDASVGEAAADALDKIGWQPGQAEIGAAYWVFKRKWNKCINRGA